MRLIDANALINSIINNQSTVHGHHEQLEILSIVNRYVVNLIQNAPTVVLEEKELPKKVPETYWSDYIKRNGHVPCSKSGCFAGCPPDKSDYDCTNGMPCVECWSKPVGYWRAEE